MSEYKTVLCLTPLEEYHQYKKIQLSNNKLPFFGDVKTTLLREPADAILDVERMFYK